MDVRGWVHALRKGWWIVLLVTVVGAGAGVAITLLTPKQYASSVTFFVRTPADQISGAFQGDAFAQKRVNSYVQLADSRSLADLVAADSETGLTAAQVQNRLSAKGDLNTVLLTVTATDTDPGRAFALARSVSSQFVELVTSIETSPGSTDPTVSLVVTSAAVYDTTPIAPRPVLIIALATILGLLLGAALAIVRGLLDTSVRSAAELGGLSGAPVLASIPYDKAVGSSPLIGDAESQSLRAEAFRQLRTNLQFADVDHPVQVVVVSSALPADGKSSTATNLAVSFAQAGNRVLLMEADLRRPRVAQYLGLEGAVGLTNVLAGQVTIEDVLQPWGKLEMQVLPSGAIPPNPSELLGSSSMRHVLEDLRTRFDMIVIDTPPLLPVTDAAVVTRYADGALLVTSHGRTTRSQLGEAVKALQAVDARLLGCILNKVPQRGRDGYGSGYGYAADPVPEGSSFLASGAQESSPVRDEGPRLERTIA